MKLAICTVGELFGGVERQVLDLCTYFRREGDLQPLVILFHDRELAKQLRKRGVEPVILEGRHRYDPSLVGKLRHVLQGNAVEVVHAHGYKATIACALVKSRCRFRLVKTEHGRLEAKRSRPLAWFKARMNFLIEQFFTRRHVDHVCYVTRDIQDSFAADHRGLARSTIYNGIDPLAGEDFSRPEELPRDGISLGIVGRVTGVKGIPLAIEAVRRLGKRKDLQLVIIGTGPRVGKLQEMVHAAGLSDRIRFLGFRENIFDYLANIDVLLMPSYHEGLPYTLLEAMSLGRAIIAAQVGGLRECLEDGETALLFPKGGVSSLHECIEKVITDPGLAARLGAAAREKQSRDFTLDRMGSAYRHIYRGPRDGSGRDGAGLQ